MMPVTIKQKKETKVNLESTKCDCDCHLKKQPKDFLCCPFCDEEHIIQLSKLTPEIEKEFNKKFTPHNPKITTWGWSKQDMNGAELIKSFFAERMISKEEVKEKINEIEMDKVAHSLGKCSYSLLALCSGEEQRIKQDLLKELEIE